MSDKGPSLEFTVEIITFMNRASEYYVQGQILKNEQRHNEQNIKGDMRLDRLLVLREMTLRNSKCMRLKPNPYD